ncbi:MAG: hypothetical protein ACREJC_20440, partial [Tepidisphaeraceae bacterium]
PLGEEGEFLTAGAAARADLAGVQSSAEVQRISAASLAANTPAALRECWSAAEWNALPASVRRSIRAQARRSGTLFTAGNDGSFCLLPTAAGLAGELQPIQKIKRGYFGSSSRGIGASAPPAPEPTLIGLNRLALDYFAASQGGR